MAKTKSGMKNALIFFIGATVMLLIIVLSGNSLLQSKKMTKAQLEQELNRLPVFDRNTELQQLMWQNKITQEGLDRKCPPLDELNEQIERRLKADMDKQFDPAVLEADLAKIRDEVGVFPEKVVEIQYYNDKGGVETIKGKFERRLGEEVFIGGKSIKLNNILPDYKKQFLKTSEKKKNDAIKNRKTEFETRRQEYATARRPVLEQEAYLAAGYILTSNKEWMAPGMFIDRELELRKRMIETEQKEMIASLRQKYKVWGIIPLNLKITNQKSIE